MLKSLELLKPYGRFLELGKRDYFADTSLGMRPLRRNISYFSIDIDALAGDKPELVRDIFRQAWTLAEQGIIAPLPLRSFPPRAAAQAFRTMQQARHTGKLVLDLQTLATPDAPLTRNDEVFCPSPDTTCLVTGGTAGFGLSAARWLVERGARHLLLLSRNGLRSAEAAAQVEHMRELGAVVRIAQADVADVEALGQELGRAMDGMPPLGGVIHAAALLDDCTLANLTPERMRRVLRTKALGAWNLHLITRQADLDFFVLFSSATTLLGNPGQGNYVAANSALETLVRARRSAGLPGLAVCWGPIFDVGMLTRAPDTLDNLKKGLGLAQLHSGRALELLGQLLVGDEAVAAVFSADAKRMLRLPASDSPRFALLKAKSGDAAEVDPSLLRELRGKPREEILAKLSDVVRKVLAAALRMQEEHVRLDMPLSSMGVDSLMAVELGLALETALGEGAPHVTMSTAKTVTDLARNICAGLPGVGETTE
jgi:phthiocerol/phenolphthiocerol synthesis type-I polyketide synthase C